MTVTAPSLPDRVCRRGHLVQQGVTGVVCRDRAGYSWLMCRVCAKERTEAHERGDPLPDMRLLPNLTSANPWTGREPCPQCGSSEWTMPQDPKWFPDDWRCVACHVGWHR